MRHAQCVLEAAARLWSSVTLTGRRSSRVAVKGVAVCGLPVHLLRCGSRRTGARADHQKLRRCSPRPPCSPLEVWVRRTGAGAYRRVAVRDFLLTS